ncbi:MAG: peptidylprolyl isomerase [Saprospiraceae bacterium]
MCLRSLGLFSLLLVISSCSPKMVNITADKKVIKITDQVKFSYNGSKAKSITWNFGDGTESKETNPSHRFAASGNYVVGMKANFGNKIKETSMNIEVKNPEHCLVVLETKFGNMTIRLYDETPTHRDNFIKLVEEGFFKDLLFHRVISGFMIQGGDPNSRNAGLETQLGSGGPNYTIPAEFKKELIHKKGAICAARTGDQVNPQKRSSGSQFYIVQGSPQSESSLTRMEDQKGIKYTEDQKKIYMSLGGTPMLDQDYTVFGEVVEGLDIIDKIASVQTGRADRPVEDVKMNFKILK